jgi:hypothetical protein
MVMENVEKHIKENIEWIDGFVDDNSLFTNLKFGKKDLEELLAKAKEDAQLWEGLLSATGGELELKKCFYYVLSWKWDNNGNPIPENIKDQQLDALEVKMTNSNTSKALEQ